MASLPRSLARTVHAVAQLEASASRWLPQSAQLAPADRDRWLERTRTLVRTLRWEPTHDFAITAEMAAAIAGHIAYVILGLDRDALAAARTVVVSPTTMILTEPRPGPSPYTMTDRPLSVIGHTSAHGPMFVAWDAVIAQAARPDLGGNVVFHEVAHRLDVLDGTFDGTPPMADRARRRRWIQVCQAQFDALRAHSGAHVLRPYAGKSPAEFFAVATEVFFTRGGDLGDDQPELYAVLADYYRQTPAHRAPRV